MTPPLAQAMKAPGRLLRFLRDEREPSWLDHFVTVKRSNSAYGPRTTVTINHRLPAEQGASEGWRVTTNDQFLSRHQFPREARDRINRASAERGRRLYAIEVESGEVVAALSYHLDDQGRLPVLITAIALRIDAGAAPDLHDRSRAAALLLAQYLRVVARKTRRDGVCFDFCGRDASHLEAMGFKRAAKVKGLTPRGALWRLPDL